MARMTAFIAKALHKQKKSEHNISKSIQRYFLNGHIHSHLHLVHNGCITTMISDYILTHAHTYMALILIYSAVVNKFLL